MKVPIGVSARHMHMTKDTYQFLFQKEELTELKPLKQTGQYAATDQVMIKTKKGQLEKVRILGPFRDYNQIEISKTDAYKLGINPPVHTSGNVEQSEPVTVVGPYGEIELPQGCIIAERHLHISRSDAETLQLKNHQPIAIRVTGDKAATLEKVHVKIAENTYTEVHLDTDDANACLLKEGDLVEVVIPENE